MRFLADENLDFAVVRGLRSAGHDVRALAEVERCEVEGDASLERAPSPEADGRVWWRCTVCETILTFDPE